MFKEILHLKLKIAARLVLHKYKPEVIGITGSVGKTSAKEAIYTVLESKFNVRKNIKNYNNEIGLPLTVIGVESPGKNPIGWFNVGLKVLRLMLIRDKNYPKILILEMGIDRPGDMDYLCNIIQPRIGVVTNISQSHLEYFESLAQIQKEKSKLIKQLPKGGWAVLSSDNEKAKSIANLNKGVNLLTYGFSFDALVRARDDKVIYSKDGDPAGLNFKLAYNGSAVPVMVPGVVGSPMIKASLAAAALGVAYGMNSVEISDAMRNLKFPPGRSCILKGIDGCTLVDDTYNASPVSAMAIIAAIDKIRIKKGAQRWAILGDMLELGSFQEEGHKQVGCAVTFSKINKLIVVGDLGFKIGKAAQKAGMKESNIYYFKTSLDVCEKICELIKKDSLILVKGSQGARMERVVKRLMNNPENAHDLLVRQGKEWS